MGQPGQHLRRPADNVLHLLCPVAKVAAQAFSVPLTNGPALHQLVHIQAVGLGAGHTARADVGLIQVAKLLQVAHFVADGGGTEAHFILFGNGAAAYGDGR